jgi:hypothetical protein
VAASRQMCVLRCCLGYLSGGSWLKGAIRAVAKFAGGRNFGAVRQAFDCAGAGDLTTLAMFGGLTAHPILTANGRAGTAGGTWQR